MGWIGMAKTKVRIDLSRRCSKIHSDASIGSSGLLSTSSVLGLSAVALVLKAFLPTHRGSSSRMLAHPLRLTSHISITSLTKVRKTTPLAFARLGTVWKNDTNGSKTGYDKVQGNF